MRYLKEWVKFGCDKNESISTDQIDGLMRLLEDYYICEKKMVKESVDDDIDIITDYFYEFEDNGGKVFVVYDKLFRVYHVNILTSETNIRKKINWKRISQDFDIIEFSQKNQTPARGWKRTFKISLYRKSDKPALNTLIRKRDETMKKLKLNELVSEPFKNKLFEEIDAFSRVGNKGWVDLKSSGASGIPFGDERVHYFRRFEPENILPYEMDKLKKLFNDFNGEETLIEPEIPSDSGYRVKIGAFSVKLNCGGKKVPFNFYKRWDDWWLIWCKYEGSSWDNMSIKWCEDINLYGSSCLLCDSLDGIEEFLNDYNPGVNESG